MSRARDFPRAASRTSATDFLVGRQPSCSQAPALITAAYIAFDVAMDVDKAEGTLVKGGVRVNAEAGPSSPPEVPVVFLPPQGAFRQRASYSSLSQLPCLPR